ncbi:hypothetical protein HanIR_Chr13g0629021 [Helianthus annuus]|nr:hypothetical protein HanIR_Chr13g0629021 [Helianthus annuus]
MDCVGRQNINKITRPFSSICFLFLTNNTNQRFVSLPPLRLQTSHPSHFVHPLKHIHNHTSKPLKKLRC